MTAARGRRVESILGSPYLALLLRLAVGSTLIFSGIAKLLLHSQFVVIVKSYELLPDALATAYGMALPWAELLFGAYLLLGILLRPSAVVIILMGISFMIANVRTIVQGGQYCGTCFGEVFPLTPSQAVTIDILVITAALILLSAKVKGQLLSFDNWFAQRQRIKATDSNTP